MNWTYNGLEVKSIDDFPSGTIGFVYCLFFSDSTYYFGSKQIISIRGTESTWKSYEGSSKSIKEALKSGEISIKSKEILDFAISKQQLAFKETETIICRGALEDPLSRNGWVKVNLYKKNIINPTPMKITKKRNKKK